MAKSTPGDYRLSSDCGYGFYDPTTNYIQVAQSIPASFPEVIMPGNPQSESDILLCATTIEEYLHYMQFASTQFGLLFRLLCLVQSELVIDALGTIGRDKLRLRAPWNRDECLHPLVESIRVLEATKRLLFAGDRVSTRDIKVFEEAAILLQKFTPLTTATISYPDHDDFTPGQSHVGS